ncbi:MAG: TIGR04500 family putative peptide maturation system protein [Nitrospira sp.]
MCSEYACILEEAAELLRALPRGHGDASAAKRRISAWREKHPGLEAELLVDRPPGSLFVDYDLLLGHLGAGTLGLTWREDDGLPWSVHYADHWAANFVVTVNGKSITVQQALQTLRTAGTAYPDVLNELVNHQLLLEVAGRNEWPVSDEELQQAADRFRHACGLHRKVDMAAWLEQMGLSRDQFTALMDVSVRNRKAKEQVTADRIEPFFHANRDLYDQVGVCEVTIADENAASRLRNRARETGLPRATEEIAQSMLSSSFECVLTKKYAGTLPANVRNAVVGEVVGPGPSARGLLVAEILSRRKAELDDATRQAVQEAIYQEWLARQRASASIQWHWV